MLGLAATPPPILVHHIPINKPIYLAMNQPDGTSPVSACEVILTGLGKAVEG